MNQNTKASQKFRAKQKKAGLVELRGIFAPQVIHKIIKDKVKEWFKL